MLHPVYRIFLILPIFLILQGSNLCWGADFQRGLTAAQSGDYATALREWKPLAEQGYARAQSNLGYMYVKGQGVIQDKVYAHMWWNIAASSGHKDLVKKRDIIAKQMTPSQLEKAQDLARECVRKKYKGC